MEVIENTMEMSYSILFGSPLYEERIKDKNKILHPLLNVYSGLFLLLDFASCFIIS